jgi:hypothetical protein
LFPVLFTSGLRGDTFGTVQFVATLALFAAIVIVGTMVGVAVWLDSSAIIRQLRRENRRSQRVARRAG